MKTFKQILDQIYGQAEINETESVFADYSDDKKLNIQLALAELWAEQEFSFRSRSTTFNTVAEQAEYDLPFGKIKRRGVKESTSTQAMNNIPNADNLSVREGRPYYYFVEENKLCLYPTPDDEYSIKVKYFTSYKAKNQADEEKTTFILEDDVLNIPEELEDYFIMALGYKTIMLMMKDPTDEIYVDAANQYAKTLKLLTGESIRTSQSMGFIV